MIFDEEKLRFDFLENKWSSLLHFDKTAFYQKAKNAIDPTKAVDFLGIYQKSTLVFVEVKDFRGHRIETKPRMEGKKDPLWLEVSKKVRDSIPVIVGAARNSSTNTDDWKACSRFLQDEKKIIHIVLWLEQDLPPNTFKSRKKREMDELFQLRKMKNSLEWLTTKIEIASIHANPFPDSLTVTYQ